MRLGAHFGLQRIRLNLAVALEGDAIDQIALGNVNDDVITATGDGNVQNRPLDFKASSPAWTSASLVPAK